MTYPERISNLDFICRYLLDECPQYLGAAIPDSLEEKQQLMRSLLNVRPSRSVSDEFLRVQDAELQQQLLGKGIFELPGTGLLEWQGDITRLKVDAIVNAANSQMLGCFVPMHRCIDNAIHSAAGIQLRLACDDLCRAAKNRLGAPGSRPVSIFRRGSSCIPLVPSCLQEGRSARRKFSSHPAIAVAWIWLQKKGWSPSLSAASPPGSSDSPMTWPAG